MFSPLDPALRETSTNFPRLRGVVFDVSDRVCVNALILHSTFAQQDGRDALRATDMDVYSDAQHAGDRQVCRHLRTH